MKKILIYTVAFMALFTMGCSEDFLNLEPKADQTEQTAFQVNQNFETFSWGYYMAAYYKNYGYGSYGSEQVSDNMYHRRYQLTSWERTDTKETPNADGSWNGNYSQVRRANLMIDNVDGSKLNDIEKNHWRGVGYFFKADAYIKLLTRYGGIQLVPHTIDDSNVEILYGKRNSRDETASRILELLQYASANVNDGLSPENSVNKSVVDALLSRFGLFEASWRKYHGLADEGKYYAASVAASEALIAKHPVLHGSYDELYNLEDLSSVNGVLLYRKYDGVTVGHGGVRIERTSEQFFELTKDAVNSYLCSNGKTIEANARDPKEPNPYVEFKDRDHRLYFTTPPPYRVSKMSNTTWNELGEVNGVDHSEYIRLMDSISKPGQKLLPAINWSGRVCTVMPHYHKANNGQGFMISQSGYWCWKFYSTPTSYVPTAKNNSTDYPIYRMGEVFLNYAEAKFELGQFDQDVADATINKLRARAGVAPMNVGSIDASFDANRDADVAPLLWEIRRERRIELMGENFRPNDLRRWKKGEKIIKRKYGAWIEDKTVEKPYRIGLTNVVIDGGGDTGYAVTSLTMPRTDWPDYYYLYPIPKGQIILNKNLEQNPGWEVPTTVTDSE